MGDKQGISIMKDGNGHPINSEQLIGIVSYPCCGPGNPSEGMEEAAEVASANPQEDAGE